MFYRFFIAAFFILVSFFSVASEKNVKVEDDIDSFNIFLFDGYLAIPNHYFIHGVVGERLELSSFETGGAVKVYYEKPEHVLKAINLMSLRNKYTSTEFGFHHIYRESNEFGSIVYLYSDKEAFYASGIDRAFYDFLISKLKGSS